MQRSNQLGNLESLNCKNNKIVDGSKKTNLTMTLPPATRSLKTHQDLHQDRHGGFLAGKESIVAATSPTCRRRCHQAATAIFYFSKSSQGPSLGCLASRGGPVHSKYTTLKEKQGFIFGHLFLEA